MVIASILVFIFIKIRSQQELSIAFLEESAQAFSSNSWLFVSVIFLMPVNWWLEAKKWQILSAPIQQISMSKAYKAVVVGLSLSFVTPHGVGDYFGRILWLNNQNRSKLIGSLFLGRIAQMAATLIFGGFGIHTLFGRAILMYYSLLCVCLVIIFFMFLTGFKIRFERAWYRKLMHYIEIVKTYSYQEISLVFMLSVVRYMIFCTQFVMVLSIFTHLPLDLQMAGATWIFLAKSVLPTFNFLSDLGVREFSAVYFFEQFGVSALPVVSASLLIWVINILIPTIVGVPLIWRLKIRI